MHDLFKERLTDWRNQGLWRERKLICSPQEPHLLVNQDKLLSFSSNDYLGLANHQDIIEAMRNSLSEYGAGSGSSAMVSGHNILFHILEEKFANLMNLEKALHFSTGYMANIGVINAITISDTAIFSDELNHASLIDGIRLAKPQQLYIYKHNDLEDLENALRGSTQRNKWIVTDGVFSMDGDVAFMTEMLSLAEQYNAYIYVDDAHGFGVLGKTGKGVLEQFNLSSSRILYMATLGKAMGVFGALVGGDKILIDWILQKARTYIFTTGSPPALAAGSIAALTLLETDFSYVVKLKQLIEYVAQQLGQFKQYKPSNSAIHPIIVGSNDEVMNCMETLLKEQIWVPAIRPPTVAPGSARLRISLSSQHEFSDIDRLVDVLINIL
jgi:8-amino-7-oxononanoate synthase